LDDAVLVNIVHNDFHDNEKIFQPFFKLEEELGARAPTAPYGYANGHAN
jgi:hypothetical protein